jgi:glycogen phosphorylase
VLADFASYLERRTRCRAWRDQDGWTRKSILNTARMGRFSSDRSIREYAEKIWRIQPLER